MIMQLIEESLDGLFIVKAQIYIHDESLVGLLLLSPNLHL